MIWTNLSICSLIGPSILGTALLKKKLIKGEKLICRFQSIHIRCSYWLMLPYIFETCFHVFTPILLQCLHLFIQSNSSRFILQLFIGLLQVFIPLQMFHIWTSSWTTSYWYKPHKLWFSLQLPCIWWNKYVEICFSDQWDFTIPGEGRRRDRPNEC